MKPPPFQPVQYEDPKTHYVVKSDLNKKADTYGAGEKQGETEVLDAKGTSLWKAPLFLGRHYLILSPDGRYLVTWGSYWFGGIMGMTEKEVMASVIENGKVVKKIPFSELYAKSPKEIANEKGLRYVGGGWIGVKEFLKELQVDWSKNTLIFKLTDGTTKEIAF